jgi:hypothetical protein
VQTSNDGSNCRAAFLCQIPDHDADCKTKINFLVNLGDGKYDEKVSYGILLKLIEQILWYSIQTNRRDLVTSMKKWYGILKMSLYIMVHSKSSTRTTRVPCIMF